MKSHQQYSEHQGPQGRDLEEKAEEKRPYEAPRIESVKLSDEAAESLT